MPTTLTKHLDIVQFADGRNERMNCVPGSQLVAEASAMYVTQPEYEQLGRGQHSTEITRLALCETPMADKGSA